MFLDYFALGVLIFVFLVIFYGIIILHDIPYLIAKKRNHPHADAIHVAGWVSLFTLHVIWPFLWIWATLYRPERGWGMQSHDSSVMQLQQRIAGLEKQLADIKSSSPKRYYTSRRNRFSIVLHHKKQSFRGEFHRPHQNDRPMNRKAYPLKKS